MTGMADQRAEGRNGVSASRPTKEQVLADLQRMESGDHEGDTAGDEHGRDDVDEDDGDDEHGRGEQKPKAKSRRDRDVDEDDEDDEHGRDDVDEDDDEDDEDEEEGGERARGDEDDDDEEDEGDEEDDAELARRRAALKKTEKHQREKLDREYSKKNADLEAREKTVSDKQAAVERYEKAKARAKYDAVGVLRELGLTEDDFEAAAQQIYAHSKAAAVKPEHKAAAERAMRDRRLEEELAKTRKDLEDMQAAAKKRDEAETNQREAQRFVSEVADQASAKKTPIVKRLLKRNADGTRRELAVHAMRMAEERGELPTPRQVVRSFEKFRRRQLEDAGVDVEAMLANGGSLAAPGKKGASNSSAAGKKGSKGGGGDEGKAKTREQLRDELELELSEMDLKERRKRAS